MSYIIISNESGTCAALPLRDSWGSRLTIDHWTAQVEPLAFPPRYRIQPNALPSASPLPASPRVA